MKNYNQSNQPGLKVKKLFTKKIKKKFKERKKEKIF